MDENPELNKSHNFSKDFKIIIVGDSFTGKTSIIERYMNNTFSINHTATITPEFSTKIIKSNNIFFRFQFWDLPGQDKNPVITSVFCKDSNGIIFCCDASNEKSRENLKKWDNSIKNFNDISNIPKIILENKCDKLNDEKNYNDNIEPLRQISNELDCLNFFRVSALNGYNIKESIDYLINECIIREEEIDINKFINISINSKYKDRNDSDSSSCC